MQCNPQYVVSGPPNCSQFYSFNPPYPPPCSPPYPDIIGEGEVKSLVLADGSVQHYFLPTSKWSPPYLQNSNSLNYSPYCNPTTGAWFIRSVPNAAPCTPFVPQPCVARFNYACNSPIALPSPHGIAMKFHNDNWTSTTDLQYFIPRMRKLMLTPPQICVGVQSDVNENSCYDTVYDNPCNCGPDCRNIRTPIFNGQVPYGAFTKQEDNRFCCTKEAPKVTGVASDMSIDESKHTSSKTTPDNEICKCNSTTNNKPIDRQTRKKKSKSQSSISDAKSTKSYDRKSSITCKCELEIKKTKQREEKLRHKKEKTEERREKESKTKQKEQSKLDKQRKDKEEDRSLNNLYEIQSSSSESDNSSNDLSSSQASESKTSATSSGICSCCKGEDEVQKKIDKKQKKSKNKSKKQEAKLQKSQKKEQIEQESLSTESMTTTSCSLCSFCGERSHRQDDSEKPYKDKETKKQKEKDQKQKKKELKRLEKEQKHKEKSRKESLTQEKSKNESKKQEAKLQKSQKKEQIEQESSSTEAITTTTSCSICSLCGDRSRRQDESEKLPIDKETKKQMEKDQKQKKKELKRLEKEQKHEEKSRKQSLIQEEKRTSQSQNHKKYKISSESTLCECLEPEEYKTNVGKNLENSKSAMSVDGLDITCNFCTDCVELTDRNTRDVFSECFPPPTSDKLLATQNDQACSGIFGTFCGLDFSCGCPFDLNDAKLVIDKDSVEIRAQPLTNANDTISHTPGDFSTRISDSSKTCIRSDKA